MNTLYQQMTQQAQKPNSAIDAILSNNPAYAQVMREIKQSGMTPKELFYQKARQMGIDPASILSQLR